jgi:hypothetical protein
MVWCSLFFPDVREVEAKRKVRASGFGARRAISVAEAVKTAPVAAFWAVARQSGARLTVLRSLTEARRRRSTVAQKHSGAAAVENALGEEPRGSELPVALSGLNIPQT